MIHTHTQKKQKHNWDIAFTYCCCLWTFTQL